MARILIASNHNKDWYNERFLLFPLPEQCAKEICESLNRHIVSNSSPDYYKVVPDDYQLYIGMEA